MGKLNLCVNGFGKNNNNDYFTIAIVKLSSANLRTLRSASFCLWIQIIYNNSSWSMGNLCGNVSWDKWDLAWTNLTIVRHDNWFRNTDGILLVRQDWGLCFCRRMFYIFLLIFLYILVKHRTDYTRICIFWTLLFSFV